VNDPDGVKILVPAFWDVPGATAVPTTRNKGMADGRLAAFPAPLSEILTSGGEVPGALFRANGRTPDGAQIAVIIGVYDTGPDPLGSVIDAASQVSPGAIVTHTTIAGSDGVRIAPAQVDPQSTGASVICDYWAQVPRVPTSAALTRFWRLGAGSQAEERLCDDIADTFNFTYPSHWRGWQRPFALSQWVAPSPNEPTPEGAWRWAGSRLGTIFSTKCIPAGSSGLVMQSGVSRSKQIVVLALYVLWLVAAMLLIGFKQGLFLLASFSFIGSLGLVRQYGSRGVLAYAIVLAGLLAVGLL
jgi:hypothetical protein